MHEAVAQHDQGDRGIKEIQKRFATAAPIRFVESPGQAEVSLLLPGYICYP